MEGKLQVIEGVYPITRAEGVYIDDNKTLKQAIENGDFSGGNEVISPNNYVTDCFFLVNDVIFNKNSDGSITINLNTKLTLNRILCVCFSNGSTSQVSFVNGTVIPEGHYLTWNVTDGFSIKPFSNGLNVPYNSALVGINYGGRITGGALKDIWDKYYRYTYFATFKNTYNVAMEEIPRQTNRTLHSMVVIGDELLTLECYNGVDFNGASHVYSLPDLTYKSTFTLQLVGTRKDNLYEGKINLRLVTADYNFTNECLILGSGTADGSDTNHMQGYIFYDAKNWKNATSPITFENTPHTVIELNGNGLFDGEECAKLVWSELPDVIYFTTSNLKNVHKILLGVGTNKLEHGFYSYDVNKRYNGTYKILKTYSQETPEVGNKDVQFYKGAFYYSVKFVTGGLKIYKSYLTESGGIESDLILYNPVNSNGLPTITGSPEGIVVYNDKIIASHATYGIFYVTDIV